MMGRRPTPTLTEAMDQYMVSREGYAKNTQLNDRSQLRRFVTDLGPERLVGYLTATQVEAWFRDVAGRTRQPASFNQVVGRVSRFLAYCGRHGWVHTDLMVDVHRRRVSNTEKPRLSAQELVDILDAVTDPRDRGLIALAGNTGLRKAEITSLTVSAIDLDECEVYFYRGKSYADDRLGMTPMLVKEMRRWLTAYTDELMERRGIALTPDMRLFPARYEPLVQSKPMNARLPRILGNLRPYTELNKAFTVAQRALRNFGIEHRPGLGLHTFRRSAARAFFDSLSELGYDDALRQTMSMLGHKNSSTTEIYLGLSGDRRKRNKSLKARDFLPTQSAEVIQLRTFRE